MIYTKFGPNRFSRFDVYKRTDKQTDRQAKFMYIILILICKVLLLGKLIADAYTLRTYLNQCSRGGNCKQE